MWLSIWPINHDVVCLLSYAWWWRYVVRDLAAHSFTLFGYSVLPFMLQPDALT